VRLEPTLENAKFTMDDASPDNIKRLQNDAKRYIAGEIKYDEDDNIVDGIINKKDVVKNSKDILDQMIERLIQIKG